MPHAPLRQRIRKQHVALALVSVAALSWAYGFSTDQTVRADTAGIPMAIAKDDRVSGNLEMFLKVDGIAGNSMDNKHKGEIDIDSYSWNVSRPLGAGKPSMQTFTVTMPAGRASAKLFLHTAGSVKMQRVILAARKAGAGQDFLTWTLTDVNLVSFQTVGNTHGDGVQDAVSFSFGKIEVSYLPPEGGDAVKAGWDQRTGKSVGY